MVAKRFVSTVIHRDRGFTPRSACLLAQGCPRRPEDRDTHPWALRHNQQQHHQQSLSQPRHRRLCVMVSTPTHRFSNRYWSARNTTLGPSQAACSLTLLRRQIQRRLQQRHRWRHRFKAARVASRLHSRCLPPSARGSLLWPHPFNFLQPFALWPRASNQPRRRSTHRLRLRQLFRCSPLLHLRCPPRTTPQLQQRRRLSANAF